MKTASLLFVTRPYEDQSIGQPMYVASYCNGISFSTLTTRDILS